MKISGNLRKAAILMRSVDAESAATLLAQLSTDEAMSLREALRGLGPVDSEEQADVLAEFHRQKPLASEPADTGVELSLSSIGHAEAPASTPAGASNDKRFQFLAGASAKTLASYLGREHAQTIAVVLSHLPPERAAAVLAALPEKAQADAMERLSNLGDTDSDVVAMLESEMAAWVKARVGDSGHRGQRRDTVNSILAAADATTREAIVAKLKTHNPEFANRIQTRPRHETRSQPKPRNDEYRIVRSIAKRHQVNSQLRSLIADPPSPPRASPPPISISRPSLPALPRIDFDHLIHMDSRMLAELLEVADPTLLALALAGSNDDLVERICDQMPKRIAKAFRRELRRMGPTRLSDVEAAQGAIADLASRQIALRRNAARDTPPAITV